MSGYLQRLLDTAAAGEATRVSTLAPVVKSTSPVFEQNQLLALGDVAFGTVPLPRPEPLMPTASPTRRPDLGIAGRPATWPPPDPDTASAMSSGLVDPAFLEAPRFETVRHSSEIGPPPATAPSSPTVVSGEPGAETGVPRRVAQEQPAEVVSAAEQERWNTVPPPPSQAGRPGWSNGTSVVDAEEAPPSVLAGVKRPSRSAAADRRSSPTDTPRPDLPMKIEPRVRSTPDAESAAKPVDLGLERPSRPRPVEMTPRPPRDDGPGLAEPRTEAIRRAAPQPRITIGRITIEVAPDTKPAAVTPPRPLTAEAVSLIGPLGRPRTARRLLALRRL
jgi:hypothetical protein